MIKDIIKFRRLLIAVYGFILLSLLSCASIPPESPNIAAYVDNDPITIGDIEYSLQVAHRREGLSKTKGINISDYLNKVIDERLLVHEARRMGMNQNPGLLEKVDAYVLRESVSRLYNDEILDKVVVSEKEIIDYFNKEYEQYTLSSIETGTAEDARIMLEKLKRGMDFGMLARESSEHENRKSAEEAIFARKDLTKTIKDIIDSLKPGEISEVFEAGKRFYLVQLISRHNAPEDELNAQKENIKQAIMKNKVQKRSDEYLEFLTRKMKPEINEKILSLIPHDGSREERVKWLQDGRTLVKLRDASLTVGEFVRLMKSGKRSSTDKIIKQWIDRKVVDYEALDRKYYINTDLKDKTNRYKNKMLKKMFVTNVLSRKVEISEDELMDFYHINKDDFSRPARYKVQQITSKTGIEAEEIKTELINAADFSWMAKNRSIDNYASDGGTIGWRVKEELPAELKKIVGGLEQGEISDVMISGNFFRIYRLQEKKDKKVEEFEKVRPSVHKKVFTSKYKELYESYIDKLKEKADIEINNEVLQDLDDKINNETSS